MMNLGSVYMLPNLPKTQVSLLPKGVFGSRAARAELLRFSFLEWSGSIPCLVVITEPLYFLFGS
jgi:hypothetical protein